MGKTWLFYSNIAAVGKGGSTQRPGIVYILEQIYLVQKWRSCSTHKLLIYFEFAELYYKLSNIISKNIIRYNIFITTAIYITLISIKYYLFKSVKSALNPSIYNTYRGVVKLKISFCF